MNDNLIQYRTEKPEERFDYEQQASEFGIKFAEWNRRAAKAYYNILKAQQGRKTRRGQEQERAAS